jgi:hypothetical protein
MEKIIIGASLGGMPREGTYDEKHVQEIITFGVRMQVPRGILSEIPVSDISGRAGGIRGSRNQKSSSAERYGGTVGTEHPAGPHPWRSVDCPEIRGIRTDGILEREAGLEPVPEV